MAKIPIHSYEDLRKKADEFLLGFCMGIDFCAFGESLPSVVKCDRKKAG